jgi:hypothetical protein
MIVHAYVQLSTSAAHGSMGRTGVQLSKLSAEVHEYEGGLEGARPCVGPQAYVVIVLIVGGGPCGLARIAIGMRQLGTVGSSWTG